LASGEFLFDGDHYDGKEKIESVGQEEQRAAPAGDSDNDELNWQAEEHFLIWRHSWRRPK
jgi:hypothetical protein